MDIKRRQFLHTTAAGLGTIGLASANSVSAKPTLSKDPLAYVDLTEKIKCTRIGFGTGMRGGQRTSNMTRSGLENATRILRFAYDQGIRLFDVADLYGTHPFLAEAMKDKPRDSYTIISKIWVAKGGIPEPERHNAETVVKRFLQELKTDYIDLIQLHCMTTNNWTDTYKQYMDDLAKLKEQGLIRGHGVSTHANVSIELAAKTPWVDALHVRVNSEGNHMDGKPEDVIAATKVAHAAGKGTIAMKVIGQGDPKFLESAELRKKSTEFVVQSGLFDTLVVGFEAESHITEFIENVGNALKSI